MLPFPAIKFLQEGQITRTLVVMMIISALVLLLVMIVTITLNDLAMIQIPAIPLSLSLGGAIVRASWGLRFGARIVAAALSVNLAVATPHVASVQVAVELVAIVAALSDGLFLRFPYPALARAWSIARAVCFLHALGVFLCDLRWYLSNSNDEKQAQKSEKETVLSHRVLVVDPGSSKDLVSLSSSVLER